MRVSLDSAFVADDVQRVAGLLNLGRELRGKHLLITGSTGFLGKWLLAMLAFLNRQGAAISVTAVSRAPADFLMVHPEYANAGWISWLKHDVRDPFRLTAGCTFDLIIHAATDTLAAAHADPLRLYDTIVGGARHVLDLAVTTGVERIPFTGSGAQYGRSSSVFPLAKRLPVHATAFWLVVPMRRESARRKHWLQSMLSDTRLRSYRHAALPFQVQVLLSMSILQLAILFVTPCGATN